MKDFEHPENRYVDALDSMNKLPPEPHSFDELADTPDPIWIAEQSKKSTRQAIWWAVGTLFFSLLIGLGTLAIFRLIGGPECGPNTWICSDTQHFIWMPLALIGPTVGMVGAGVIMLKKLNGYVRWSIWMGTFWFCALHFMLWGIDVLQVFLDWQLELS